MKCSLKTMVTLAATLLAALGAAYVAFPAAQGFVVASAPILLALICPVTMIVMMLTMRGHGANAADAKPKAEMPAPRETPDVVQEA
ncbi:DUF2933 domain-containing protein [Sphaerotilus sp.]|uniref:DUF2933 domain-containing protein n=1 Tax=Sphaerotilus sp. TaxID=2093942 RepID=UPI002ACD78DA|nr:DUF2933 domain-containing protein [Sphaerotilus sp.]MDZ7855772.1 DUF2933 domain-containing protein [Sphaerotilus sp.]